MSGAVAIPVVRLESDDYTAPRGTLGFVTDRLGSGRLAVAWLPPEHGSSVPVEARHVAAAGEMMVPLSMLPLADLPPGGPLDAVVNDVHVLPDDQLDEHGNCAECGQLFPHRATCSRSLMRSGVAWLPPKLIDEASAA